MTEVYSKGVVAKPPTIFFNDLTYLTADLYFLGQIKYQTKIVNINQTQGQNFTKHLRIEII